MDFNEWKPKGFASWHQYYKWQHICDVVGLVITGALAAMCMYTCGG